MAYLKKTLLAFLCQDVVGVVTAYAATVSFKYERAIGESGKDDGQMNEPVALVTHKDEVFVSDYHNRRIQVFHTASGRYLRSWAVASLESFLEDGDPSVSLAIREEKMHVAMKRQIDVYVLSDCSWTDRIKFSQPFNHCVAYGDQIIACSDEIVSFFDRDTGKIVFTDTRQGRIFNALAVSKEGQLLVSDARTHAVLVFS
jgi:hypothetical protein